MFRKIPIPRAFLTTVDGRTFGGDIRIGDFNADGRCDFLVYRCNHGAPSGAHVGGIKPAFMGAFQSDGRPLWSVGSGGNQPSRPMSVAVRDLTGDGCDDVICFWHQPVEGLDTDWRSLADVVVQIRDGRNGQVILQGDPKAITERRMVDPQGSNWVHQRILIANFRGTTEPRDFVIKLGDTYVALDESLRELWRYQTIWTQYSHCPAYIPAVGDIDGDGKDELNGGYFVLDSDGTPLWEEKLGRNMDSVAIAEWDNEHVRAICSGEGHVVSADGEKILALGKEEVPHGQEVRVADFDRSTDGNEMVIRYQGHSSELMMVGSETGKVIRRMKLNESPTNVGMEAVYWNGIEDRSLLFNGGWIWDLESGAGRKLPSLPPANGRGFHRMAFYHAIAGNVCGGDGEDLVLWDPTATDIFVYTFQRSDSNALGNERFDGYESTSKQYNPRIMD